MKPRARSVRDLKELRELAVEALNHCASPEQLRRIFRPEELDYLCEICAILTYLEVCGEEDLPEFDVLEDEDA